VNDRPQWIHAVLQEQSLRRIISKKWEK
jgi:hypothetical protein